jgi:hypothetical protein
MFACINGARLFFDVEGAGLVPDGPGDAVQAKPGPPARRPRI